MAGGPIDDRAEVQTLLANLRAALPELRATKARCDDEWGAEDGVYRFYHQSMKTFDRLQPLTEAIVAALAKLSPDRELNAWFRTIVAEGTGKQFAMSDNKRWLEVVRPIVEAFFHARYFLDMACKYGAALDAPPNMLPSGWAAFLCLYDLR